MKKIKTVELPEATADAIFKVLKTDAISISGKNPRKRFVEAEMEELSNSIAKTGLLMPILVRPIANDSFELVCGERRLKASQMAGIAEIPCYVRELSDEMAFEAMILENLQRKDVHPMEESDAFRKMIDSGNYTIADIAAKMAKTEVLVAQRLKLADLIDPIKDDFFNNELSIGHAVLLSRISAEAQESIYDNFKNSYRASGYGTLSEMKDFIEDGELDLEEATFDINDANLVEGCTACTVCPKRAGANPLLFSDIENPNTCFDSICYGKKKDKAFENDIRKHADSGKNIKFIDDGYKLNAKTAEMVEELQIFVLAENKAYRTREIEGVEKGQGFVLSGYRTGQLIDIWQVVAQIEVPAAVSANLTDSVQGELTRLATRESRNKELDLEKIQAKNSDNLQELIKKDNISGFEVDSKYIEGMMLYFALNKVATYELKEWVKDLGISLDYKKTDSLEVWINQFSALEDSDRMKLLAKMIHKEFRIDRRNLGAMLLEKCLSLHPSNKLAEIKEAK